MFQGHDVLKPWRDFYVPLSRIGFALAIAFILNQFPFDYLESVFYDTRMRLTPPSATSGHIELIAVDPETVESLGRFPNANDFGRLLKALAPTSPAAVISLLNPSELVGSAHELMSLAESISSLDRFYVANPEVILKGEESASRLPPPFEKLQFVSTPATRDSANFAADEVTRRFMISYLGQKMLQPIVAGLFNPDINDESKIRGAFEFLRSKQAFIDFKPARTYPTVSFLEAMSPARAARFTGKIVLIGRDTQSTEKDYVRTPYSRAVVAMTLLEHHANVIDTLILNSSPIRLPKWMDLILTFLITLLTLHVVLTLKPTMGLLLLAGSICGFYLLCYLAFWWGGLWVGMAQPSLAVFVCYYFFIPYRLIIENRRSWEYLQKNRLLTQVEELKTNFLSMMSHDLKTPIARIQGMTDIVLTDANPLSPRQREALRTLNKSSEELLHFISSILNLGRIESKELRLHLQSRDPNSLLEEVVEKADYLAKSKHIEIMAEFDPLFSVKMDVDLMRQVFSNLLENAIKYSPENSRILVTSEECDGRLIIQVADQGAGIPEEELPHVFTKFYRSKDAKSSAVKGSGLGLYLAKYFVELHGGRIFVDSRVGEGSTFSVELPVKHLMDDGRPVDDGTGAESAF